MLIPYCNLEFYYHNIYVLCNVLILLVLNRFLIWKAIVDALTALGVSNQSSGQGYVPIQCYHVTMDPVDGFTAVLTTQLPTVTGFIACL